MRIAELPVVFLSYDEPWADGFFDDLRGLVPAARRVHGVKGLDACHKAAADAAGGPFFLTVDADTRLRPGFLDETLPDDLPGDRIRVEWPSRNAVNGLVYGNGSLKLWPAALVRRMRTHEAAPRDLGSLDHDIGRGTAAAPGSHRLDMPRILADTHPAETPFHAFRCGFREGVRLSLGIGGADPGDPSAGDLRLLALCSVAAPDAPNGPWLIYGARLGVWMNAMADWDPATINDYGWFARFWEDLVAPRFAPGGERCRWTGYAWDRARLMDEIAALGARLRLRLDLDLPELSPQAAALFLRLGRDALARTAVDSRGTLHLKGRGVPQDAGLALDHYAVGEVLGLSASVNNIARVFHLGQGRPADPDMARARYAAAVAMGNRHAPYHLAALLEETGGADATTIAGLRRLAAERGFDPDGLLAAPPGTGVAGVA